ncbi:MAG TPA: zinc ribbon domain-containing protein [Solirubrobacteraceae bacterium]
MSVTDQVQLAPIPSSIDNLDGWGALVQQIESQSAVPTVVTPELIAGVIGSAVPLLFEADTTGNANLLRGTFIDPVIAQRERNVGDLMGAQPRSVAAHLVGIHMTDGHPVLRAHLRIELLRSDGTPSMASQFWDLQLGAQVMVGQANCPNCGAPIGPGELLCSYCKADCRNLREVPLVVSRLELY